MADLFPFYLNGKAYTSKALATWSEAMIAQENSPKWEKDLAGFFLEWLSESNTVAVHTSGSTGTPKTIYLSKEAMRTSAKMTGEYFALGPGSKALLCLPIRFIAGKMMVVRAITLGWHLWTAEPGSHPLAETKNTFDFIAMVPLQLASTLEETEEHQKLQKVQTIIIGGGAVSPELEQKVQLEQNAYYVTYGMTETITHIAVRPMNGPHKTDLYTALPGVTFSQGSDGALHIQSPHLGEEALQTTDLVSLESKQQFRWLGRSDNVLITGGIKVIPEVVEAQLKALCNVSLLMIGLPDEKLGQRLVLLLEDNPWTNDEVEQLEIQMRQRLPPYDLPKEIHFYSPFSRTDNGKVQRKITLARFLKSI